MRRIAVLAVIAVAAVAWAGAYATRAQDATPGPEEAVPAGLTIEVIASGESAAVPPAPASVSLLRFDIAPGAVNAAPADDPSLALIYEETGTVTVRLAAPVVVSRAATGNTEGSQEEVAAGTAFMLGPGDSFVWPPNVTGEVRNEGAEPATALVVLIAPAPAGTRDAATPASSGRYQRAAASRLQIGPSVTD